MHKIIEYFSTCRKTVPNLIIAEVESLHPDDEKQKKFIIGAFSNKNWTKKLIIDKDKHSKGEGKASREGSYQSLTHTATNKTRTMSDSEVSSDEDDYDSEDDKESMMSFAEYKGRDEKEQFLKLK